MRHVCAPLVKFIVILLLFVFAVSSTYAQIDVVEKNSCDDYLKVFEVYRNNNTHTASAGLEWYDQVLCYEPLFDSISNVTLTYRNLSDLHTCFGNNRVFYATSPTNAHVAEPHLPGINPDPLAEYPTELCYGYLECIYATPSSLTDVSFIQTIAKTNANKNAHLSQPSSTHPDFPYPITCLEPVCNEQVYSEKTQFPTLYTFDNRVLPFEFVETQRIGSFSFVDPADKLSNEALALIISDGENFTLSQIKTQNWSGYAALDFFVFYTEGEDPSDDLALVLSDGINEITFDVSDHYTSRPKANTWNKVRIPLFTLSEAGYLAEEVSDMIFQATDAKITVDSFTFIPYRSDEIRDTRWDTLYCSRTVSAGTDPVYEWIDNLDANAITCANIQGHNTTGTYCCGDDYAEFFSDADGCFNSVLIPNDTAFSANITGATFGNVCVGEDCNHFFSPAVNASEYPYVEGFEYAYQDNKFYYCGNKNVGGLLFTDVDGEPQVNNPLLEQIRECGVVGEYFCDVSGYFSNRTHDVEDMDYYTDDGNGNMVLSRSTGINFNNASLRNTSKVDAFNNKDGCCPADGCLHNGTCYENMANEQWNPGVPSPGGEAIRCIDGSWTRSNLKINFDGSETGFCQKDEQCLITTHTNTGAPRCIESDTYFLDYYCYEGNFTSRTAITAKFMTDLAVKDNIDKYTLFCDEFESTLNYLGSIGDEGVVIKRALEGKTVDQTYLCGGRDCVNNFCVLNPNSKKVRFGTSINYDDINDRTTGLGAIFNLTCPALQAGDEFVDCTSEADAGDKYNFFYYPQTRIFVFQEENSWLDSIWEVFTDIISFFTSFLTTDATQRFENATQYNRYYYASSDDITANGFTETLQKGRASEIQALLVVYDSNAKLQVCDILEDATRGYPDLDFKCIETENAPDDFTYTITSTDARVEQLWTKLTAGLRPT